MDLIGAFAVFDRQHVQQVFIQLREGRTAVSASAYDDEINADNQKNQTQAEAKDDKDDEEKEEETDEGDLSDGEDQRCQMKQNV